MKKRIVVAGSREYNDYDDAKRYIDKCISLNGWGSDIIIVSGGSKGADLIGERYAAERGFEIERYPAEWEKYGKKAGPVRNKKMAEISDLIICFWDGKSKGTRSMIDCAEKLDKTVIIKKF